MRSKEIAMSMWILMGAGSVQADPQQLVPGQESASIQAMLKFESDLLSRRQALLEEKKRPKVPKASLIAIFGVLPKLHATVLVGNQEVTFVQGQGKPLIPANSPLRLRYIKPPCISLKQQGRHEILCLKQVGL